MPTLAEEKVTLTGPVFVGTVLNWCLLGTLVLQVYIYILTYPEDSRRLKCLVAGLFALELLQTGLMMDYSWRILVSGWGDASVDRFLPWSAASFPALSGTIALIVQLFFAWRIWVLQVSINYPSLAKSMSIVIAMVALLQSASAIYGAVAFGMTSTWERVAELTWIVEIWLGGSLACDILIAVTMISIYVEAGRGSPWSHTAAMVNKLIIHAIETGAVTAITALVDLVLFELYKDTSIHQAPALILGKLYTNALMVSLNGRKRRQDSINLMQQQSALSHIQTQSSHTDDYELTIRSNSPHRLEGSKTKDGIVIHVPDFTHNSGLSIKLGKTLDSPV